MVIKRHYKVIILKDNEPIEYCCSNTLHGVLDFVDLVFSRNYRNFNNLELDFKIIRYEFGISKNCLAEDLPTA